MTRYIEQARRYKVLTISDKDIFCKKGGLICIVNKNGKLTLEINLPEARKQGFNISSNLLEMAIIVRSEE